MRTVNLRDKRLNARLTKVLSQLSQAPTASIPAACGGRAEMTAAYRFFDNEKAAFEDVLRPHNDASLGRIAAQPAAILVQDTTELDLTRPEQAVEGAGPLAGSRMGALLHVLHAFTPDGTPLGTVSARAWTRDAAKVPCASKSRSELISTPIEEKESHRWVATLRDAQAVAEACPSTQTICVADSEADVYEVLAEAATAASGLEWIVRGGYDRALQKDAGESSARHLRELALASPVLFLSEIHVRGRKPKIAQETRRRRQPRQSRDAEVAVRAMHAELRPPWRADRRLPSVSVNVVMVQELDPPPGEEPVEWLLLTSLPIDRPDQVRQIVEHYATRWMIEIFFRVLKSGCRVEERRFEAIDRLLSCAAVYLIVAWRTLYVCRLGRGCPDASCEAVFEPAEWKATWKVVRGTSPPRKAPKLGAMLPMVAELGGYVPRSKSPPGPQTVWLGLRRVHDFALCWETFGPDARRQKHV
jgi:hypothetical protein